MPENPASSNHTDGPRGLLPGTWARRALSIPGVHLGFVLWLGLLPLTLLLLGLTDLLLRRRLGGVRFALFVAVLLSCEVWGVWASAWIWLRHSWGPRYRFLHANGRLQQRWGGLLWRGLTGLYRVKVDLEGAEAGSTGPMLLLVRHASSADTLLPTVFVTVPHGLRLRFVLKQELLWDPCLDVVGQRMPNHFVDRSARTSEERAAERDAVAELARGLGAEEGVVIFPEGTRFSERRRQRRVEEARKAGDTEEIARLERYTHCFPPRPAGVLRVLDAAPEADVVFCAHSGFEEVTRVANLWNGGLVGARVRVRLWRVSRSEVPTEPDERYPWLLDQWDRVEEFVERG